MPGNLALFLLKKTFKDPHMCVHMPRPQIQPRPHVLSKESLKAIFIFYCNICLIISCVFNLGGYVLLESNRPVFQLTL